MLCIDMLLVTLTLPSLAHHTLRVHAFVATHLAWVHADRIAQWSGSRVPGTFAEVVGALHACLTMSGTERPAKRARLEADKRRDVLAKVQDQYADIDFTRFQKAVDADETGEATPYRFVLVRPTETALVKDWRQWSSYEPGGAGQTLSEHWGSVIRIGSDTR